MMVDSILAITSQAGSELEFHLVIFGMGSMKNNEESSGDMALQERNAKSAQQLSVVYVM